MKNAESLRARLGANMAESMGDVKPGAGGLPAGFALPTGQYAGCTRIKDALAIEVSRIVADPDQPRKEFDEAALDELAGSLKARGQLQPIRVRWDGSIQKWVVIAGERRYRAAIRAGLPTLACIEARGEQSNDERLEDQLVENCLREDLKPIEQAVAFKTLMERRGWSYRELGEFLHISKGTVAKAIALLDLPEPVQEMVEQGSLPPNTAYEVSRLDDVNEQAALADRVVAEGLSAQEASAVVRARKAGAREAVTGSGMPKVKPIQIEVRPGVLVSIKGTVDEVDAIEVLRSAANLLRRRSKEREKAKERGQDQAA
jgi:ParB family chromosome partitioning protein